MCVSERKMTLGKGIIDGRACVRIGQDQGMNEGMAIWRTACKGCF